LARKLFDTRIFSVLTSGGAIGVGWLLNWYVAGTSTRTDSYNAPTSGSANTNPVVSAADGRFGEMWLPVGASYKYVLTDENGVVKVTVDNYAVAADPPTIVSGLDDFLAGTDPLPIANGGTASETAADALIALGALPLAGGMVTDDITRSTKGVYLYHSASAMTSGEVHLTASGATDPTSAAGEIWAKY
jgi:hypothetical protein